MVIFCRIGCPLCGDLLSCWVPTLWWSSVVLGAQFVVIFCRIVCPICGDLLSYWVPTLWSSSVVLGAQFVVIFCHIGCLYYAPWSWLTSCFIAFGLRYVCFLALEMRLCMFVRVLSLVVPAWSLCLKWLLYGTDRYRHGTIHKHGLLDFYLIRQA